MANPVVLDSKTHGDIRVNAKRGAEFGENIHMVPVIAEELPRLVLDYPVCLIKDPETGQFELQALLGFEAGENLFLTGNRWEATYVPMHLRRQPFMVGIAGEDGAEPTPENTIITIDMESARVSDTEGERLFDENGGPTPYLQSISNLLGGLIPGLRTTEAFIKTLVDNDLIESATFNAGFVNGENRHFEGLPTVSDEKLRELDDDKTILMHDRGHLQASYLLLASFGQVNRLINLKDARIVAGGTAV